MRSSGSLDRMGWCGHVLLQPFSEQDASVEPECSGGTNLGQIWVILHHKWGLMSVFEASLGPRLHNTVRIQRSTSRQKHFRRRICSTNAYCFENSCTYVIIQIVSSRLINATAIPTYGREYFHDSSPSPWGTTSPYNPPPLHLSRVFVFLFRRPAILLLAVPYLLYILLLWKVLLRPNTSQELCFGVS
jgi:hypothetical protein